MFSPGQKHGGCGHLMARFDTHSFCARCREKGKGPDPCVSKSDCQACNVLTEDQRIQLSTPSYRIKKERRDSKKQGDTPQKNSDSSSLIDPSSVMVVGAVDDQGIVNQGILQSPGSSSGADKKKKDKKTASEKPKSSKSSEKPSKSVETKLSRFSADDRIDELDRKWADHFNRLEALLLAKSLDQPEPTFQAPKVAPTHPPPVGAIKSSAPFIRSSMDQQASSDLPGTSQSTPQGQVTSKSPPIVKQKRSSTTDLPSTDHPSSKKQFTSKSSQPNTSQPSDLSGTGSPALHQVTSKSTSAPARDQSVSSMDTDSDSDVSDRPEKVNSLIRTWMRLPTPTRHYLRIRPTEKPYRVLDLIWVGHTSQI